MIQIKKLTPLRCKILWTLGFTSISRMFASCSLGVKPYKGCKGCENNVREQIIEAFYKEFQRGFNDGLKQRDEMLFNVGECNLECLRRVVTELDAKKGGAE